MKTRREPLAKGKREHLLLGYCLLPFEGYPNPDAWSGMPYDDAEARRDWEEHREELMTFWIQDPVKWSKTNRKGFFNPGPGGPGTRPAGWWWFDGPAELFKRKYSQEPPDADEERALLARHGLLTEAERLVRPTR